MDLDDPCDDTGASASLANWQRQLTEEPRPFEAVCLKLASSCGAIPLGSFLSGEYQDVDLNFNQRTLLRNNGEEEGGKGSTAKGLEKADGEPSSAVEPDGDFASPGLTPTASLPSLPPSEPLPPQEALDVLHQICLRLTGTEKALDFDIVEAQPQCFECILTVTSLKGTKRAYKSVRARPSAHEAKQEAAKRAVEMCVVDFIRTGDPDVGKHKKAELIARAKIESVLQEAYKPLHPAVQQIEDCCLEWRAGKVVPSWAYYRLSANATEWGTSLRVALSLHQAMCYSSDAKYETREEARAACAEIAIAAGVLDYIKYGNGQTSPTPKAESSGSSLIVAQRLSLQEYFEGLPRPFPTDIGDIKNASDLHPVSRVNTLVQNSRVPQLRINYYGTNSSGLGIGAGGLSGCVLRLELPDRHAKTYIVDNHFAKRQDAKAAVCLLAMSQDLDAHLLRLRLEAESKLPHPHRLAAQNVILPALRRITRSKGQATPLFAFLSSDEGHGCELTVDFGTENKVFHKFTSKAEYSTKLDGTLAVVCLAARKGLFELIRYGTTSPPEGQRRLWDIALDSSLSDEDKAKIIHEQFDDKKKRKREDKREEVPEQDDAVIGEITELISASKHATGRANFKPGGGFKKRRSTGPGPFRPPYPQGPAMHYRRNPPPPPPPPLYTHHSEGNGYRQHDSGYGPPPPAPAPPPPPPAPMVQQHYPYPEHGFTHHPPPPAPAPVYPSSSYMPPPKAYPPPPMHPHPPPPPQIHPHSLLPPPPPSNYGHYDSTYGPGYQDPRYASAPAPYYPHPPTPIPQSYPRGRGYIDHDRVERDVYFDPRNPYPHPYPFNAPPEYESRPPPLPYD